jgi:hypothetical protein
MVRTLDAARDDKLWDKQTATYEEIIAYLLFLQAKRRLELRRRFIRYNTEYEEASERLLGDYKPASWWEMQARLAAYGSPEALAGFEASHAADTKLVELLSTQEGLRRQGEDASGSQAPERAPDIKEIQAVRGAVDEAHKRADETDQALVKVLRDELNRKPSQGDALTARAGGGATHRTWRRWRRQGPGSPA